MANQFTGKQQKFIDAYLGEANFNATRAAKIAGYEGNGNTLAVVGFENLRKHKIAKEIKVRLQALAMSADELLMLLGRQARSKNILQRYLSSEGVNLEELIADGHGNLIKSMKPSRYGLIVEFVDDLKSQELIARHLNLFENENKLELTHKTDEGTIELLRNRILGIKTKIGNQFDTERSDK